MNKKETILVTVLAMLCGLVGGRLSLYLFPQGTIVAREFRVVDQDGENRARFGMKNDTVGLELEAVPGQLIPRASFYLDERGGAIEIVGAEKKGGTIGIGVGFTEGLPMISLVDGTSGGAVLMGPNGIGLAAGDNIRSLPTTLRQEKETPVSTLVLYDGQGEILWATPQTSE